MGSGHGVGSGTTTEGGWVCLSDQKGGREQLRCLADAARPRWQVGTVGPWSPLVAGAGPQPQPGLLCQPWWVLCSFYLCLFGCSNELLGKYWRVLGKGRCQLQTAACSGAGPGASPGGTRNRCSAELGGKRPRVMRDL